MPLTSETEAFRLTAVLRDAARLAWTSGGREGVDIPAIEYLDGRSLSLVPDRLLARAGLRRGGERPVALLVRLELPPDTTASQAFQQIAAADGRAASPLGRFCALLARYDAFDATEIALPGDATRAVRSAPSMAGRVSIGRAGVSMNSMCATSPGASSVTSA